MSKVGGTIAAAAAVALAAKALIGAFAIMVGVGILEANGIVSGTLSFVESLGLSLLATAATAFAGFRAEIGR